VSTREQTRPPASEWIIAGISLALVLGAIAFLAYDAMHSPAMPPDVRVSVDSVVRGPANYVARFTARNLGGATAANVEITGELFPDSGATAASSPSLERSTAVIRYIPANSRRSGGLFFTRDPRRFRFVLRAEGFTSP